MTRRRLIDPRLQRAGWVEVEGNQVEVLEEEAITDGALVGNGRRGRTLSADYVLQYKGVKLAVVEAKREGLGGRAGGSQVHQYSELIELQQKMQLKYGYGSDGHEIIEYDLRTGANRPVNEFPSPQELWDRTFAETNAWRDKFYAQPMHNNGGQWTPRYYKEIAINRVMESIANHQDRMLLTLATGTGKTSIAKEIVWKLFHTNWNRTAPGQRKPKVLFLADRTILADQAFQAFNGFERGACTRFTPQQMQDGASVPTNADIIFTIYQTFMSGPDEAPYFGQYEPDFFDLVIIDECHRGGANDQSTWRSILNHFSSAVHLGLTATPKREDNVDTYKYFGEPLFEYSLKSGIEDGFLTPFRVVEVTSNIDTYQYQVGDKVVQGELDEDHTYSQRELGLLEAHIKEREEHRVTQLLELIQPDEKSIVFCQSQMAAAVIRDLINDQAGLGPDYCQRVTSDEGVRGDNFLKQFRNTENTRPTILTTSSKLSTGVDARQVKNVVLMRPVGNIIEFKQIIGRGTRISEDKDYFTLIDFAGAVIRFEDKEWDGPIEYKEKKRRKSEAEDSERPDYPQPDPPVRPELIVVELSQGRTLALKSHVKTSFYDPATGGLMTVQDYLSRLLGVLPSLFADEASLRSLWSDPSTREKLLEALQENGYPRERLLELRDAIDGQDVDLFDALNFIAHSSQMEPRLQRADRARVQLNSYNPKQQAFLNFILERYVEEGSPQLDKQQLSPLLELKFGTTADALRELQMEASQLRDAYHQLQRDIYASMAG